MSKLWKPTVEQLTPSSSTVPLGDAVVVAYASSAPPTGLRVHWDNEIHLPTGEVIHDRSDDPRHVETSINGRSIGTTRHRAFAVSQDAECEARHLAIDRNYYTFAPQTKVEHLLSETIPGVFLDDAVRSRGKVPVIDEMQVHEDLLVSMRVAPLGDRIDFDLSGYCQEFDVISLGRTKKEVFDARLRPKQRQSHRTAGAPLILRFGEDIALFALLPLLDIKAMTSTSDYGAKDPDHGRPLDLADAVDHYREALNETFGQRHTRVSEVLQLGSETDPPVPSYSLRSAITKAVVIALNAVTAGMAAQVAQAAKLGSEGSTELLKVLIEESINTLTEPDADALAKDPPPTSSIRATFLQLQHDLLLQKHAYLKRGGTTRMLADAKLYNARREGAGTRTIMAATKAVDLERASVVTQQLNSSFDALNSLLARVSLRELPGAKRLDDRDLLAVGLNVYGLGSRPNSNDGQGYMGPKASDVNALLRLELDHDAGRSDAYLLRIASAAIHGVNAAQRELFRGRRIKDIRSPVVG